MNITQTVVNTFSHHDCDTWDQSFTYNYVVIIFNILDYFKGQLLPALG